MKTLSLIFIYFLFQNVLAASTSCEKMLNDDLQKQSFAVPVVASKMIQFKEGNSLWAQMTSTVTETQIRDTDRTFLYRHAEPIPALAPSKKLMNIFSAQRYDNPKYRLIKYFDKENQFVGYLLENFMTQNNFEKSKLVFFDQSHGGKNCSIARMGFPEMSLSINSSFCQLVSDNAALLKKIEFKNNDQVDEFYCNQAEAKLVKLTNYHPRCVCNNDPKKFFLASELRYVQTVGGNNNDRPSCSSQEKKLPITNWKKLFLLVSDLSLTPYQLEKANLTFDKSSTQTTEEQLYAMAAETCRTYGNKLSVKSELKKALDLVLDTFSPKVCPLEE